MNWMMVLTAMLPENLLLAGIVALVVLEVFAGKPKAALWLSVAAVTAACAAALGLSLEGYGAAPFPGQFVSDARTTLWPRRSCSRSPCPCCSSRATTSPTGNSTSSRCRRCTARA